MKCWCLSATFRKQFYWKESPELRNLVFALSANMSELNQSQLMSNQKAEEFEIFQDDDEFEEFEEGTESRKQISKYVNQRFLCATLT